MTGAPPPFDLAKALEILDVLMRALGTRALLLIGLVMTFILFGWSMWLQRPLAFGMAGAFAVCVLLPLLYVSWKKE